MLYITSKILRVGEFTFYQEFAHSKNDQKSANSKRPMHRILSPPSLFLPCHPAPQQTPIARGRASLHLALLTAALHSSSVRCLFAGADAVAVLLSSWCCAAAFCAFSLLTASIAHPARATMLTTMLPAVHFSKFATPQTVLPLKQYSGAGNAP